MTVTYETMPNGDRYKVTTTGTHVMRELDNPSPPEVEQPRRVLRDWEFRNRFTQMQLVGIMRAAMLGDDVAALVWLRLSTASDGVDLDDPDNIAGVQYVATLDPTIDPVVVLA